MATCLTCIKAVEGELSLGVAHLTAVPGAHVVDMHLQAGHDVVNGQRLPESASLPAASCAVEPKFFGGFVRVQPGFANTPLC
jgi:hypothetical protein